MEKNSITVIDFLQDITMRSRKSQNIKIIGRGANPITWEQLPVVLWEGEWKGYSSFVSLSAIGAAGKQYFKDNLDFAYACVAIVENWEIVDNEIVIYTYASA